jgi:hypothetical protein
MQSRPSEVQNRDFSEETNPLSTSSSQYGDSNDLSNGPNLSSLETESGPSSTRSLSPEPRPTSGANSTSTGDGRLIQSSTPRNRSPVDRITEHERSSISSPRPRSQGPEFKIVPRPKGSKTLSVSLTDFPNGICYPLYKVLY